MRKVGAWAWKTKSLHLAEKGSTLIKKNNSPSVLVEQASLIKGIGSKENNKVYSSFGN